MPELIIYATSRDAELIRNWINDEREVAWIVKVSMSGRRYSWKAESKIPALTEPEYAIWHVNTGPLNIPSGVRHKPDAFVADPFAGWQQTLDTEDATAPWFGDNVPGSYLFRFRESGREAPNSLGRSGFYWALDRYRSIGKPAHPDAKRWWFRLKRFLAQNATAVGWPSPTDRVRAYVFPDAQQQGRHRDINP